MNLLLQSLTRYSRETVGLGFTEKLHQVGTSPIHTLYAASVLRHTSGFRDKALFSKFVSVSVEGEFSGKCS